MKKACLIALGAAAVLVASTDDARAAGHANGFGEKGQIMLSADRLVPLLGYTHSSVDFPGPLNNGDQRSVSSSASGMSFLFGRDPSSDLAVGGVGALQPLNVHSLPRVAFDVTIINRLTLGAGLAFAFGFGGNVKVETVTGPQSTQTTELDAPSSTAFGFIPRVGYILPLGEHLAFWPRGGIGLYSVSVKSESSNNNNNTVTTARVTDTLLSLDLDPQLAIIPVEHFFITVGPMLNIPLTGGRTRSVTTGATTAEQNDDISLFHFGIHAGLGGWLNVF